MNNVNEREIAAYTLMDITDGGGFNNIVLKKTLAKYNGIDSFKKNMITEIVNGTLRNLIFVDYITEQFSSVPVKKQKPFIRSLIRISVYQLMFMDKVPQSAVCNEGVKLAKNNGLAGLSGFVNGLLRNIARNKNAIILPNQEENLEKFLSVKYSYPLWLIDYWLEFLTIEETIAVCKAGNIPPEVSICINTLKTSTDALKKIFDAEAISWKEFEDFPNALSIKGFSDLSHVNSFNQGLFHVMDTSSMKAIDLIGLSPGKSVLDICAAPGSKSFYSAYLMNNDGRIQSMDVHEHRLKLTTEGSKRLGIKIMEVLECDGTIFNSQLENNWDAVILDAPCTGFGVLRKKPDAKYNKNMEDVENLQALQRKLLSACWRYPKIGGKLLYSTCTISQKENGDNLTWFLDHFPYELVESFTVLPKIGDGFFAALLIRTA